MSIDKALLLAELRELLKRMPSFASHPPNSRLHLEWLARTEALIKRWNSFETAPVRKPSIYMSTPDGARIHSSFVVQTIHHAIPDLEPDLQGTGGHAFGPVAVYDFGKALSDLIRAATQSLPIVDPYLDDQVFDSYLSAVGNGVTVRLLARKYATALRPAVNAFMTQTSKAIDVRVSTALHDRVLIIDGTSVWVLGQSIKDAATSKPTYLAPLSPDAALLKREAYASIWEAATPLP